MVPLTTDALVGSELVAYNGLPVIIVPTAAATAIRNITTIRMATAAFDMALRHAHIAKCKMGIFGFVQ